MRKLVLKDFARAKPDRDIFLITYRLNFDMKDINSDHIGSEEDKYSNINDTWLYQLKKTML